MKASLRLAVSLYCLTFLLAVSAARHRHLDSFEDLVFGGPSDSGTCGIASPFSGPGKPEIGPAGIDDDPCLACFHNDYDAAPAALAAFREDFAPFPLERRMSSLERPHPIPDSLSARSPPDRA